MQGRFHYYEGYTMQQITYPIRVMKFLGVQTLLVSNACGGMNPQFRKGDVMLMTDHINLLGDNPLIGPNENELGPRFPDMSEPYSQELINLAEQIALENKLKIQKVFTLLYPVLISKQKQSTDFCVQPVLTWWECPPSLKILWLNQMGMKVLGISIITDECFPDSLKPVNVQEIIETAMAAEPKMTLIMKEVIRRL